MWLTSNSEALERHHSVDSCAPAWGRSVCGCAGAGTGAARAAGERALARGEGHASCAASAGQRAGGCHQRARLPAPSGQHPRHPPARTMMESLYWMGIDQPANSTILPAARPGRARECMPCVSEGCTLCLRAGMQHMPCGEGERGGAARPRSLQDTVRGGVEAQGVHAGTRGCAMQGSARGGASGRQRRRAAAHLQPAHAGRRAPSSSGQRHRRSRGAAGRRQRRQGRWRRSAW